MLDCVNGPQANKFARSAFLIYIQNWFAGMLPHVILDGKKELFKWDRNLSFLENICRLRTDRSELSACNLNTEIELLETEYDNIRPVDTSNAGSLDIDYSNFWNTPDEDDEPIKEVKKSLRFIADEE